MTTRWIAAVLTVGAGPALCEPPPAGWAGTRWVDEAGCLFQRAELGDRVLWGEVLTATGAPLCGLTPTRLSASDLALVPRIPAPEGGAAPVFPAPGAYAQVGAFGSPANAERALALIGETGLAAVRAEIGALTVLYVGPLAATTQDADLARLRGLGFADAFLWLGEDG